jgi:adenine phosphoribosyltransferase
MEIKSYIREFPDFPKKGVLFRDITPILRDPEAFARALDELYAPFKDSGVDAIVGVESRGFIFGAALAAKIGKGFIMLRKKGKLPGKKESISYKIEYGEDIMEMQVDAIKNSERVLIIDDLLATGGTAEAAARMVEKMGGVVVGLSFLIELTGLNGRELLKGRRVESAVKY